MELSEPWRSDDFSPCEGCPFSNICEEAGGCLKDYNDAIYETREEDDD